MADLIARSLDERRLETGLIAAFAIMALLLAGIGVYGVTSYAVARRIREFGIRMALGANPGQLVRMAMGRTAAICALGAAAGLMGVGALSRFIQSSQSLLCLGQEPPSRRTQSEVSGQRLGQKGPFLTNGAGQVVVTGDRKPGSG